jgi:hypothetical protein
MAQTRRVEKHNEKAYLLSAPRFSPYLSGQFTPFIRSPTKEMPEALESRPQVPDQIRSALRESFVLSNRVWH